MAKVTFIGAGSVEFSRNILADLCTLPGLPELTLTLHDINPERLATAEAMARYTTEKTSAQVNIVATADRKAALDGADYAINEIAVGGYDATLADFQIPAKYGVRQTIADTIGIGGIFRGLRTIPVMCGIGNDMAELCPDAWLLTYSNPMAMLPWAVYEGTPFKNVVGLCHSVRDTHAFLAETVDVPVDSVDFFTAGFNHQAFVLRFEKDGDSLYPLLDEAIERNPQLQRRVRVELYRRFGYFPTESSEHSAEYVPWFMRHDEAIERFRVPVDEYLRRSEANLDEYDEIKQSLASGRGFEVKPTHELASQVIHSIETDTPREVYGNVRNGSLIENLPPECCIEVPCNIDASGIRPLPAGRLPAQLAALNRTFLNVAELTVRAALEGDREHVYQAAMMDPNTGATLRLDQIHDLCDELIDAHREFLPMF
jgi:alpha-galactosidase